MYWNLSRLRSVFQLPRLGLVERLRLVFILIVLVIGVAVALALWQFKVLGDTQNNLVERSVPVLVRTQLVERALHDLVISLDQIEAAPSQNELASIGRSVNEQFTFARVSIAGLSRLPVHAEQADMILQKMSEMETGIQTSIVVKRSLFRSREFLERALLRLADQDRALRELTRQLSNDASQRLAKSVADVVFMSGADVDGLTARLSEQTQKVSLAARLELELETIANFVSQLEFTMPRDRDGETFGFLQERMDRVLNLVSEIPATSERAVLKQRIGSFKETIFGPQGVLAYTEEIALRTRDLTRQNNIGSQAVRNITAATERLMASAHGQLTQAGQLTQQTTQRLILILAIAAIVVASIVVLSILVIVERQINVRIALLTGDVQRIAAGDTDHKTQVSGGDELGRMAEALDIFKRNARELLRSNAELEKFSYAAAHDLKTPLQAIHNLAVWTLEDDGNQLTSESAENLQLLQARVTRLSTLLGDLLQYARIGEDAYELVTISLDEVVEETAALADPSGEFEIGHEWEGSKIQTYAQPLQRILFNLINNTVKHYGRGRGQIHISSTLIGDRLWMKYTDDGPGIDPQYHAKVFELFQTLKPRDETEGSGLGLAITQKLIESFDGSVSIQSDPAKEKGLTLTFDFPAQHADQIAQAA